MAAGWVLGACGSVMVATWGVMSKLCRPARGPAAPLACRGGGRGAGGRGAGMTHEWVSLDLCGVGFVRD